MTELKNNPVATRTRIKRVEKTLADDFTLLAPCRDKIKAYEEIIHYIRSGAETPIIERPLRIVTRRQFIKNKRAKDKA